MGQVLAAQCCYKIGVQEDEAKCHGAVYNRLRPLQQDSTPSLGGGPKVKENLIQEALGEERVAEEAPGEEAVAAEEAPGEGAVVADEALGEETVVAEEAPGKRSQRVIEVLEELLLMPGIGRWAIPAGEVQLGTVICRTVKSTIYTARWRGTKVVAKFADPLVELRALGTGGAAALRREDAEQARELLQEIQLLSMVRHPDIVMFLGACLEHAPPFFIIEYMEGGDLEKYYKTRSKNGSAFRPPWAKFRKWALAVARALCFLHNCPRPIIHRDLKPLNVLLNSVEDAKVTDFGLSKLMAPLAGNGPGLDGKPAPYMSGGVGTWRYMAPEVVRYEPYTDRADIYSFALLMWFMYTGRPPFIEQFGRDAEKVLKEYLKGNEPRPDVLESGSKCGPPLPQDIHQLLRLCWHTSTEERPSAETCVERLEGLRAPSRTMSWTRQTS